MTRHIPLTIKSNRTIFKTKTFRLGVKGEFTLPYVPCCISSRLFFLDFNIILLFYLLIINLCTIYFRVIVCPYDLCLLAGQISTSFYQSFRACTDRHFIVVKKKYFVLFSDLRYRVFMVRMFFFVSSVGVYILD